MKDARTVSGSGNRIVVTGPPGSGKTHLLEALARMGFHTFEEPARAVLAAQRAIGGDGTYDRDPRLFVGLMLARAVADFKRADSLAGPTFFDRAIPDLIGYAELFALDSSEAEATATRCRYAEVVLALPSWPEIYGTDTERRMTFEQARAFGERVRQIYVGLGYEVVDVPADALMARISFVLGTLGLKVAE